MFDSLIMYLQMLGTADGYVTLDTASTPMKFVNPAMGYDATNKRLTFTGSFTPTMTGNIRSIYFSIQSPSGLPIAELLLSDVDRAVRMTVNVGVTYRLVVSILLR